ncbi:hypothetical protein ASF32_09545 [Methylobacterium sp. Leaf91]|nr:hypothetical protein ASF32_09545 [Methylobacterium sp. Leaf91]
MALWQGRTLIVVVVMVVVPALAVVPTFPVERPVAVIPMRTVDDDIIVVAMMVAVDVDVPAAPVEVAAIVLGGRGGRGQDQADGDQGWNANSHGSFLKGVCLKMGAPS